MAFFHQLTGSIPSELGNLNSLRYLDLKNNELSGNIPSELSNLSNLEVFSCLNNNFSGGIPSEFGNLNQLQVLYLDSCQLTGNIPPELGSLTQLLELELDGNSLSGTIPPELSNLNQLRSLFLYGNQLTGNVPVELGNLNQLQSLRIDHNKLTGPIPDEFANLDTLSYFQMDHNYLTDIPDLSGLAFLTTFNVSSNPLGLDDIAPNLGIPGFVYDSLLTLDVPVDTVIYVDTPVNLSFDVGKGGTQYHWYKNDSLLTEVSDTVTSFTIEAIGRPTMGTYRAVASHPEVPGFTLNSELKTVLAGADITGKLYVSADSTPAESGSALLMRVQAENGYDTTAMAEVAADGSYTFEKAILYDYIITGFADTLTYENALPTYYQSTVLWEEADTIVLVQHETGVDIINQFNNKELTGVATISGIFEEELDGPNGRTQVRGRIRRAGIAIRRRVRTGKTQDEAFELVTYVYTNENGEFAINNLEEGEYRLNFQYPGYPLDTLTDVDIYVGADYKTKEARVAALVIDDKIQVRQLIVLGNDAVHAVAAKAYPNPTDGKLQISWNAVKYGDQLQATIYNHKGEALQQTEIATGDNIIQAMGMVPGMYVLRLFTMHGQGVANIRFVIKYE